MTNPPNTPPENTEPAAAPPQPAAPQQPVPAPHQPVPPVYEAPPIVQQSVKPGKDRNVLGIIAFAVAILGFIFACIPGALIVGWVLLPIAFILSLVSLFLKGKSKGLGIAGLIISVVGTIVGVVVFFAVVATSFDEAFSGGEITVTTPEDAAESVEGAEVAADDQGTRANPYPIETAITQGDWTVTINSVDLDATKAVTDENMFNEAPDSGTVYIMVKATAIYNGTNADGEMPWVNVEYVTADGNTIDGTDKMIVAPDAFNVTDTLYEGASTSGNFAFQVPADSAAEGVLAVTPSMMGDKVFVAVK